MGNLCSLPPLLRLLDSRGRRRSRTPHEARLVYNGSCFAEAAAAAASGYSDNKITTTKYTWLTFLPKNLFEQLHRAANLYFVFIVILNFVPEVGAFGKEVAFIPVAIVLAVTCIKDGVEDYARRRADAEVNSRPCRVYSGTEQKYVSKRWSDVLVGDFVHVACNEAIPADLLLTTCHGDDPQCCYIETANLDGESSLKRRIAVCYASRTSRALLSNGVAIAPPDFRAHVECDQPNEEIYRFRGKLVPDGSGSDWKPVVLTKDNLLLRGSILRNTDSVEGLVIYAGHETKAMMNTSGPRYKRSRLEQYMNRDVLCCIGILLFLCFFSAIGSGIWLGGWKRQQNVPYIPFNDADYYIPGYQGFIAFWTYIIIYQAMVPLSLYASLEIIKSFQVYLIQQDRNMYDATTDRRVVCRALNITEELGQVQHVFCDKTGTLTENKMIFRALSVRSSSGSAQVYIDEDQLCLSRGADNSGSSALMDESFSSGSLRAASVESIGAVAGGGSSFPDAAEVQLRALLQMAASTATAAPHNESLHELLLTMALCNTVMVSSHSHNASANRIAPCPQLSGGSSQSSLSSSSASWSYRPLTEDTASRPKTSSAGLAKTLLAFLPRRLLPAALSTAGRNVSSAVAGSFSVLEESALKERYEAESPDELALVKASCRHGCRLVARDAETVTVSLAGVGNVSFDLLAVLPFDSSRRRMSVVVRHPATGSVTLYCKGADVAILTRLDTSTEGSSFVAAVEDHVNKFAKIGLRTLCMAKRELTESEFSSWYDNYMASIRVHEGNSSDTVPADGDALLVAVADILEQNLQLIGATGIEDKLQDGVGETISALREATITTWLLTGDKKETAVNIGYACGLISKSDELLTMPDDCTDDRTACHLERLTEGSEASAAERKSCLLEGAVLDGLLKSQNLSKSFLSLAVRCSTVLCCRMTPSQKASVVDAIKKHTGSLTLAIGDGANDVNMIRTAHVGVGVVGMEGSQAAMVADFAISRFLYLRRLLFVHGHWCYDRLASAILYNFYKNANLIFLLFWYQFYNGFSGQASMDQVYLLLFHVVFTSVPPVALGALDKDLPAAVLMSRPFLYTRGPRDKLYHRLSFWIVLLDAVYQSLVMFFLPLWAYRRSDVGLWTFGTTQATLCVTGQILTVALETKTWSIIHIMTWLISYMLYWLTALILSLTSVTYNPPSNPYWELNHAAATPQFWLLLVLVSITAVIPRVAVKLAVWDKVLKRFPCPGTELLLGS